MLLPIACAINQNYALPLAVMLASLKQRLRPDFRPVLYLIHAGLPAGSLAIFSALLETHSIIPSPAQISAAPRDSSFPPEAAFPLLLADVLPATLERVLFLDADLLVLDDVACLWETPLHGRILGACADAAVPRCSAPRGVNGWRALGIPGEAPYFNGGVLLIDLARWRRSQTSARVRHYLESTGKPIDFLHQGALNATVWDEWTLLDPRWNLLASLAGRSYDRTASASWREPGIVHFAGRMKPWRGPIGGPFHTPYREVLERVSAFIAPERATLRDHLLGAYDQYLRPVLFPVESFLWRQRLL